MDGGRKAATSMNGKKKKKKKHMYERMNCQAHGHTANRRKGEAK